MLRIESKSLLVHLYTFHEIKEVTRFLTPRKHISPFPCLSTEDFIQSFLAHRLSCYVESHNDYIARTRQFIKCIVFRGGILIFYAFGAILHELNQQDFSSGIL